MDRNAHKNYLQTMLVNKFEKKFGSDLEVKRLIESEILAMTKIGFVTKESIKALENRITRRLNNKISVSVDLTSLKTKKLN